MPKKITPPIDNVPKSSCCGANVVACLKKDLTVGSMCKSCGEECELIPISRRKIPRKKKGEQNDTKSLPTYCNAKKHEVSGFTYRCYECKSEDTKKDANEWHPVSYWNYTNSLENQASIIKAMNTSSRIKWFRRVMLVVLGMLLVLAY